MGGQWRGEAPLTREEEIFAVDVLAEDAAIVLVLRGELDLAGAPRLADAFATAMAAGQARIALELSQLDFIDGTSVGLIERTRRQLRLQGGQLTLRHPQPHVRRVFELCSTLSGRRQALGRGPAAIARLPGADAAAVG
jgi:anti-sigma B factor antagonist